MNITQVFETGDDQLASHFNIIFPLGIPTGGSMDRVVLRAKGFTDPGVKLNEYDVAFHGLKFKKTSNIEETKAFSIEIRLSNLWAEYKDLKRWLDSGFHPSHAGRLPDAATRTTTLLQPIDILEDGSEQINRNAIEYRYAKLVGLGDKAFDHASADPIYIKADFIYVVKKDEPY